MSKLSVFDIKGATVGDVDVDGRLLVLDRGEQAVHDAVVALRNRWRQGSASTKCKGQVAGSNKKPWRQKGTGRARAGYRQSPVWRGGGVVFGPRPHSYATKTNSKVTKLAFRRALSERLSTGSVKVVDNLAISEGKTRLFAELMKALQVKAPVLVVVGTIEPRLERAARNLAGVELVRARDVNVYQLVRYPNIVADREGLQLLLARLEVAEGKVV